ncbi:hypothetical protein RHMOL_Rhmol10G0273100 [Rhododendron molle]|uniref:Uncharacterized protein n=1 Tax=Rhododendron molle TaxID=49168 RepID=A0ACC0M6H2_RHOML|nr:hypothetical protein RHMOL_Rhmol10G0273100 [Rhododendron molle]
MGSCLSKKTPTHSNSTIALPDPPDQKPKTTPHQTQIQTADKKKPEEEKPKPDPKKEIFLIKHRISHDQKSDEERPKSANTQNTPTTSATTPAASEAADAGGVGNLMSGAGGGVAVRTSSCSKEEIDAILIQCGRLSRSSSACRKYSGSKRSYDFDQDKGNGNDDDDDEIVKCGDDVAEAERGRRHGQRHRQSTPTSSGRRRTPSRERDQSNQRSGSRERGGVGGGGGGRRVSRSPGRRSESPITGNPNSNNTTATATTRPGKLVSVPATVSSMAMDKSGIGEPGNAAAVKRISVRRNVGSPRARSPAATRVANEKQQQQSCQTNQQQPLSLSRSNSRKAEHSPYRRNPLGEIDQNCGVGVNEVGFNKGSNHVVPQAPIQKPNTDNNMRSNRNIVQGAENKSNNLRGKEQQQKMEDEGKPLPQRNTGNVSVTMVSSSVTESQKLQQVTRTRSSRLSRDLDFNPETLLNTSPTSSYTALLLEDIQNFHQKGTPVIPCLTKACSILEAVADLNSTTISNLSTAEQFGKKKRLETKEPFVESEVVGSGDDLMEPSFHKYVTVSRGGGVGGGGDMEEVESSGSNSFIGGGQSWVSSSLWETNSADSTDKWSSQRSEQKRESDWKPNGIGRGRLGSGRGLQSTPQTLKAASS